MGNVRLSYSRTSEGDLSVEDTNDFYPFGLNFLNISFRTPHPVFNPSVGFQNWKYNGKELEETGMYDYGARFYMPDLGRFGMYDPLAEKTMEPYAYVYNNPIKMIDPTGMEGESSDSGGGGEASNGGSGGSGENGGMAFAGGDPPVKGASFDGKGYDGGVKSFSKGSDGNLDTEIQGVALNGTKSESTSLPVSGSFTLGGGSKRKHGSETYNLNPIAPLKVNNYDGVMGKLLYLFDGGNPGNGGKYNMDGELIGISPIMFTVPDLGKSAPIKISKELLSKENIKSIHSLKNLIIEHQSKLTKYIQSPGKYDNLGILKNAPNEAIKDRIIQSRIQHLQHEIKTLVMFQTSW